MSASLIESSTFNKPSGGGGISASTPTAPWQKAQGDPEWAGEMVLSDHREALTSAPKKRSITPRPHQRKSDPYQPLSPPMLSM